VRVDQAVTRASDGTVSEPFRPTPAMRLSVTSTSPAAITSSPFIETIRAPLRSTDPFGRARADSTTISVFSGSLSSSA
jgi:hypothetical protein